MPAVEEHTSERMDTSDLPLVREILRSAERTAKATADTNALALGALTAEVKGLRADIGRLAPSPKVVLGALGTVVVAALVTTLAIGYLVIHLTTLIAASKGVDVGTAASATSTVITSTSDATTSTISTLSGTDAGTTTVTTTTPASEAPAPTEE